MKSFTLIIFLCCSLSATFSQTQQMPAESQAFLSYSNQIESGRQEANKAKDYLRADTLLKQWVSRYNQLPAATQRNFKNWAPSVLYNLTCYEALLGHKDGALTAFEQCVAAGNSNYAHTIADSDLESLRHEKRYLSALQVMREHGDMGYVLRQSGPYNGEVPPGLPVFSYQEASAPELTAFRNKFNLNSVAGSGDETTRMKNLLGWVHNKVRHDGNSSNPPARNGIELIEVCQRENRGVNCRMLATILKDAYQAEGFTARMVTCMPKDTLDNDCHVINVVWSNTLNKWVWMDPTFNAYVTDKQGRLLNIEEVRSKLYTDKLNELVINEDANWNHQYRQTLDNYLGYYMSKNLYWLQCTAKSEWDIETKAPGKAPIEYINLYPSGYSTIKAPRRVVHGNIQYATNNPELFWQKPVQAN